MLLLPWLWPKTGSSLRDRKDHPGSLTSPSQLSATQLNLCMREEGNTCVPVLNALVLSKFQDFWTNDISSGRYWKTSPKQTEVCSLSKHFCPPDLCSSVNISMGLPWWLNGKESACNAGATGLIPGQEDPLEKSMATHSSTLAWRSPRTEEPGHRLTKSDPQDHKESDTTEAT